MKVYRVFARPDAVFATERQLGTYTSGTMGGAMKQAHEVWMIPMEDMRAEEVPQVEVCATCGQVLPAEKQSHAK